MRVEFERVLTALSPRAQLTRGEFERSSLLKLQNILQIRRGNMFVKKKFNIQEPSSTLAARSSLLKLK